MFSIPVFLESFEPLLWAARYTLLISVLGIALGLVIGTLICAARLSPYPALRAFGGLWVSFLRGVPLLEEACRCRGWLLPGSVCDTDRGAAVILDEFRAGKLGRITLQKAPVKAPKETTPEREAKKEEQSS